MGNKMADFRVIVDADACPKTCLQILRRLAAVYHYDLITIASFNHRIDNEHHLVVGDEPQATDIAIINRSRAGDILVTQDWGLAAVVLAKHVRAISPGGRIYNSDQIDLLLEERNILAKFRRGGGRTKGPEKRTKAFDQYFEANFLKILNQPLKQPSEL